MHEHSENDVIPHSIPALAVAEASPSRAWPAPELIITSLVLLLLVSGLILR